MKTDEFILKLKDGFFDSLFKKLYGIQKIERQKIRYENTVRNFKKQFPEHENSEISVFSASGRTEIGGNHTDHQHGCVIAGAVNLDIIAVVCFSSENKIRIKSKGYPTDIIELSDLSIHQNEIGKSASLIRGIAHCFSEKGINITGFDAYTTSDVLSGSGLSSSAAFEILIGTILNYQQKKASAVELAQFGQYAENVYYSKKSGLMDQMACASGGIVFIDFINTKNPEIQSHSFDLSQLGYEICITDTKGSHSDLTDDYSAVSSEMCSIARQFGYEYLRQINPEQFFSAIPKLREKCSDRAILRAIHFFDENIRVHDEINALLNDDMESFCEIVRQSGESSACLLQNLYSVRNPDEQGIPLAIAVSKKILGKKGAVRVHGGGFAGTVQAFVPSELVEKYKSQMEKLFGENSCYILKIRPVGGIEITEE